MYEFISGTLIRKQPDHAVIETGGVGYRLKISFTSYEKLPEPGQPAKLLTYLQVREDIFDLFGFVEEEERQFFNQLITISKIGPKAAITILSGGAPAAIRSWVMAEDAKSLARLPGIGPTTARRIIAELKPRLEKAGEVSPLVGSGTTPEVMGALDEAVLAMEALGYSRTDAYARLRKISQQLGAEASTEALIKGALQRP